ncbi:hypothetical protein HMSSN139_10190 [Paenibacillus sp. HMSSN-139]|nr:hypothetical protein HMSSN139_10190 [Paenibacillus sp. HMSSN-139]
MEDKKTRIYHCGKELFSAQGFKDTNVADITRKAGVSVGTFYNYYASKEKLFMEIFSDEKREAQKTADGVGRSKRRAFADDSRVSGAKSGGYEVEPDPEGVV